MPLRSGAAATVVVFTCNHCPYALAWHERINAVARDYAAAGVRMLQISSNDAERFPRDAPAAMAARVQAGEFAGPYLYDATQEVARAWGARVTPDVFVLDGDLRLAYRGAPDADHRDESLNAGLAARGPRRRARRPARGRAGDRAGGLLHQVEVVCARCGTGNWVTRASR